MGRETTLDIDKRSITEALNRIDDFATLGSLPLAQLPLIERYLERARTPSSPFQRGRVLSHLTERLIEEQALDHQRRLRGRGAVEWSILYLRVHEGRTLEEIARELSMPLRSVARYYARAKDLLLDRLLTLEGDASVTSLHCPLCGTLVAKRGTSTAADYTCPICSARLHVDETDDRGGMAIHVRPAEQA